jgi:hypothetical protein
VQIMENEARFDLKEAITRWRQEMEASELLADEVRELESHLTASMDALQSAGLSEAEAFSIARHRLGATEALELEFAHANPARFWRRKLTWLAAGMISAYVWGTSFSFLSAAWNWVSPALHLSHGSKADVCIQVAAFLLMNSALLCFVVKLARRPSRAALKFSGRVSRLGLALALLALPFICFAIAVVDSRIVAGTPADGFGSFLYTGAAIQLTSSAALNGVLALFMAVLVLCLNRQTGREMSFGEQSRRAMNSSE